MTEGRWRARSVAYFFVLGFRVPWRADQASAIHCRTRTEAGASSSLAIFFSFAISSSLRKTTS